MTEYGWYGEAHYDYEPPDPPTIYDRIMGGCYRRGRDAAPGDKCPYTRADFAGAWEQGALDTYEATHPEIVSPAAIIEWWDVESGWGVDNDEAQSCSI